MLSFIFETNRINHEVFHMREIELKFQVPLQQQKKTQQAFQQKTAQQIQLAAKYYDTADLSLAAHKIALRQRLEQNTWVQTLKATDAESFNRFELEIDLGETVPKSIHLSDYKHDAQAKRIFKQAKIALTTPLELQFETQIQRTILTKKFKDSQIEIALDVGHILANQQQIDVFEIEFELKQGNISDLIAFIQPWIKKYQLFLDTQSKSERGQMLKNQQDLAAVCFASELVLNPQQSPHQALAAMLQNSLTHALPNTSAIANAHYSSEHVHQARVAIRRLRSVLKIFHKWSDQVAPQWESQLAEIFRRLGATRDRDALAESLLPQLIAIQSPVQSLPPPQEEIEPIEKIFQHPETSQLWLELIQFTQSTLASNHTTSLKKSASKRLQQLHHQVCDQAEGFLNLADEEKHQVRKRLKRLRYAVEFVGALYDENQVKAYLKALKPAQESLGHFNDLVVAEHMFSQQIDKDPQNWFVIGWIRARQQHFLQLAQQQLLDFSKFKPLKN